MNTLLVEQSRSSWPPEARAVKSVARDCRTEPIDVEQFVRGMRQMLWPVWQ